MILPELSGTFLYSLVSSRPPHPHARIEENGGLPPPLACRRWRQRLARAHPLPPRGGCCPRSRVVHQRLGLRHLFLFSYCSLTIFLKRKNYREHVCSSQYERNVGSSRGPSAPSERILRVPGPRGLAPPGLPWDRRSRPRARAGQTSFINCVS